LQPIEGQGRDGWPSTVPTLVWFALCQPEQCHVSDSGYIRIAIKSQGAEMRV